MQEKFKGQNWESIVGASFRHQSESVVPSFGGGTFELITSTAMLDETWKSLLDRASISTFVDDEALTKALKLAQQQIEGERN